jgi:hypothetical protein
MSVRDRKQPLRQVNKSPLLLEKAKQLARIGAQKGKHDRAVTTSPTSPKGFRIVAQYAAGAGKDVAIMYRRGSGVKKNPLVSAKERRRVLQEYVTPETGVSFDPATGADLREVYPTQPRLPMSPEEREALRAGGSKWDPYTGESLMEGVADLQFNESEPSADEE